MPLTRSTGEAAPLRVPAAGRATLVMQLAQADASVRREAARELAAHAAAPELAGRLECEADASVRAVIFSSLARIGGEGAVDGLLPLLRSEDAALRNGAIEVLAGLPHVVAPRMDSLLVDADSDVRIFAVNLLGLLPHADVPRWLARVLRDDPQPNVVGAALDVAAEVAGPELAAPLRGLATRFPADPFIAFAARLVLSRLEPA